jgi:hypothetical protein
MWSLIFLVAAVVLFILAALVPFLVNPAAPAPYQRVDLLALGLACMAASFLISRDGRTTGQIIWPTHHMAMVATFPRYD